MLLHWRNSEIGSPSITFSECTVAAYDSMVNVFMAKSDVTFKYKDDLSSFSSNFSWMKQCTLMKLLKLSLSFIIQLLEDLAPV